MKSNLRIGRILALGCAIVVAAGSTARAQQLHRRQPHKEEKKPDYKPLDRAEKQFPIGTVWILKSFNEKPVPVSDELTFSIDNAYRGFGYSGCNTWSATIYPVKNQTLAVGPVALTHKKCEAAKMKFENEYLLSIHAGPTWDLVGSADGTELVMKGQGGSLRFIRSL